jgi:hypothetical protein
MEHEDGQKVSSIYPLTYELRLTKARKHKRMQPVTYLLSNLNLCNV